MCKMIPEDYYRDIQNMDVSVYRRPSVWGPPLWMFLHTIALVYPPNPTQDDKKWYLRFFNTLPHVLPCSTCRSHLESYIRENPVILISRAHLVQYVFDLHNHVNTEYKKKRALNFQTAFRKYRASCIKK